MNIVVDQHVSIDGVMLNQYQLVSKAFSGGTISPAGTFMVTHGDSKTFEIIPNANYMIDRVDVDGISLGALPFYTFNNVKENGRIEAYFKLNVGIPENEEAIITVFSHNNIVTIMNEQLVPIQQAEIMDMYGRVVWTGQATTKKTEVTLNVAVGIYNVRVITNDNQYFTTKIVIK